MLSPRTRNSPSNRSPRFSTCRVSSRPTGSSSNCWPGSSRWTHKYLSPIDLEDAVVSLDGRELPFVEWFGGDPGEARAGRGRHGGRPKLTTIEEKATEVGARLFHYRAIRDHNDRGIASLDILVIPRPANEAYLNFTAEVVKKYIKAREDGMAAFGGANLSPLEQNVLSVFNEYFKDIQRDDRALPGEDKEFDTKFTTWLKEKSAWVPLRVVLKDDPETLDKAGFPVREDRGIPQGVPIGRDG